MKKGLYQQIKEKNTYKPLKGKELKEALLKWVEKEFSGYSNPRYETMVGLNFLKAYHKRIGDKLFYRFLTREDLTIITTIEGDKYARNFVGNYKEEMEEGS